MPTNRSRYVKTDTKRNARNPTYESGYAAHHNRATCKEIPYQNHGDTHLAVVEVGYERADPV
eukprot:249452-Chlamydomonas_euryale.AAC.1